MIQCCSLVRGSQRFGGTYMSIFRFKINLKKDAVRSLEKFAPPFHIATQCHNTVNQDMVLHQCENVEFNDI
jgi:hypothetical protein